MKKTIVAGMLCSMILPTFALAEPFDHGPGGPDMRPPPHHEGPDHRGGPEPRPERRGPENFDHRPPRHSMPRDAEALLIGGMTYYFLNGLYYQHQGSEYVAVAPPPESATSMTPLDYKGRRYYVQHGHYYSRTPGGEYVEVTRPQGL